MQLDVRTMLPAIAVSKAAGFIIIGAQGRPVARGAAWVCGHGFTVSIGVATATPGEAPELRPKRPDVALYAAKSAGRDRVCV